MTSTRAQRHSHQAEFLRGARQPAPSAEDLGVTVQGDTGPWVVLMPGLGMSSAAWDETAHDLSRDHRVIRYDRPGLGRARSDRVRVPHLHDEVAHLRRVVQQVVGESEADRADGEASRRVWVVAHSMAHFLAEAFCRSDPDRVAGLIAVDGSVEEEPRARWAVENEVRVTLAAGLRWIPGVGRRLSSVLLEDAAYVRMAGETIRLRRTLPLPLVPVVLVVAARPWVPGSASWVSSQRHLASRHRAELAVTARRAGRPAPRVGVVVFRDSGHLVMRDHPERVAGVVRSWTRGRRSG